MTIASLIVDVAANTVKLQQDVEQIHGSLDKISSAAATVGKALAAAFTATAIISAGKELLDYADNIVNVSEKTKFSTDAVQELTLAFQAHGIGIEQVASANEKLAKNLIGGDKATVGALEKMGLSVNQLKSLAPDQMFITVADAVGKIQNPTEQAYAAMTLFGKGGSELLAGLDGHLAETTQHFKDMGLVINEKTIKAADEFGDQLGLMGKQLLGVVATVVGPLLPALSMLGNVLMWIGQNVIGPVLNVAIKSALTLLGLFWEGLSQLLSKLLELGTHIPVVGKHLGVLKDASDWLAKSSANTTDYLGHLWDNTEKVGGAATTATPKLLGLGDAGAKAGEKADKAAAEWAKLTEKIRGLEIVVPGVHKALTDVVDETTIANIKRLTHEWDEATQKARELEHSAWIANFGMVGLTGGIEKVGETTDDIDKLKQALKELDIDTTIQATKAAENAALIKAHTQQTLASALLGNLQSLPGLLVQSLTGGGGLKGGLEAAGTMLGSTLGTSIGKGISMLGKLGGPIGAAIGSLAGPLIEKLFSIGGPSKAELAGRDLVKQFEDSMGGWQGIQQALVATGMSADQANAALHRMWDAEKQGGAATQAAIDAVNGALSAHEQLLAKNDEKAKSLIADTKTHFDELGTQLKDLLDKRESLFQSVSAEAPEEIMGVIEAAQRTQLGVLDDQIAAQKDAIAIEADNAADALQTALDRITPKPVHVQVIYDVHGMPSLNVEAPEPVPMASGGMGMVNGPTLFLAGEAGPEQFAFSGGNKRFSGGSGGDGIEALRREIAGLRQDQAKRDRLLAKQVRDAVLLAA